MFLNSNNEINTSTDLLEDENCPWEKFSILKKHSKQSGIGDVCRRTNDKHYRCPVSCFKTISGKSPFCQKTKEDESPCRTGNIYEPILKHFSVINILSHTKKSYCLIWFYFTYRQGKLWRISCEISTILCSLLG